MSEKLSTWNTINKTKKAEKRKWKEQNLFKNLEKQQLKDLVKQKETNAIVKVENDSKAIPTISIAVPGSILENSQSLELRTYLTGQIARAACIFKVDEIVVFDNDSEDSIATKDTIQDSYGLKSARECCVQMGRVLQYLECPQYLRKSFFPIHKHLQFCGILNPLNAPHHLDKTDDFQFREGVVLNKPVKQGKGSITNVGLSKDVQVDKELTPGLRCTVKLLPTNNQSKKLHGVIVSPLSPRIETNTYWGYSVRIANSLAKVFSQCPYKDGYDITIGTSDKGTSVDEFESPPFKHLLIVFGGLNGLEEALSADRVLNVDDPRLLFDYYLNTVPNQGSKTVRTEEAIFVSLATLRTKFGTK